MFAGDLMIDAANLEKKTRDYDLEVKREKIKHEEDKRKLKEELLTSFRRTRILQCVSIIFIGVAAAWIFSEYFPVMI